jgi:hypothetical protein
MNILQLLDLNINEALDVKVNFMSGMSNPYESLYSFYKNEFKEKQEIILDAKFDRKYILSFIYYDENEWLFAGFYEKFETIDNQDRRFYETELLDKSLDLIGKLVVKNEKFQRKQLVNFENCMNNLQLSEILKEKQTVPPFTSFSNANINYNLLCSIVKNENYTWKNALMYAKGIYLITDIKTGRLYVGTACGDVTFWDRWKEYAENGHGGNRFLKKLIALNGKDYLSNFQFSFLDIKDKYVENKEIISREFYWKEVLQTREFGYNIS